jgi:hypothetical protein
MSAATTPKRRPPGKPASKIDQAVALIKVALRDGEWHPVAPIRAELSKAGLNNNANVGAAKRRAGVETIKRPGTTNDWVWRIEHSSN